MSAGECYTACFWTHADDDGVVALLTELVVDLQDFLATVSPSSNSCITMAVSALRAAWRNPSAHCKTKKAARILYKGRVLKIKSVPVTEKLIKNLLQLDFLFQQCVSAHGRLL